MVFAGLPEPNTRTQSAIFLICLALPYKDCCLQMAPHMVSIKTAMPLISRMSTFPNMLKLQTSPSTLQPQPDQIPLSCKSVASLLQTQAVSLRISSSMAMVCCSKIRNLILIFHPLQNRTIWMKVHTNAWALFVMVPALGFSAMKMNL